MAYDYLELVNKVNRKVNEVELTASNFVAANGFYADAKDAVNDSIREINQQHFEWPFNHVDQRDVLLKGQTRYSLPADAKSVDFDSFRIARSSSLGNRTVKLKNVLYEEYLDNYVDQEYDGSGSSSFNSSFNTSFGGQVGEDGEVPRLVFRTQDRQYGLYPYPDKTYNLDYEYFRLPVDLENPTDVPSIPEAFSHVITNGAMSHVYAFRSDFEMKDRYYQRFLDGIENMRTIYINRYDYIRDNRITNKSTYSTGYGSIG